MLSLTTKLKRYVTTLSHLFPVTEESFEMMQHVIHFVIQHKLRQSS